MSRLNISHHSIHSHFQWEAFSLPELENFLKILNREEEEYVEQVRGKYRMLKIHMERRSKELCPSETTITDDKRTPVFV